MPKFIYVSDNKIQLYSPIETVTFTCVNEQLLIDFVTITPTTANVLWTQTAGSTVTIVNPTSITPTIIFPPGFNTEGGEVIIRATVVGQNDLFVTIKVNTKIGSDHQSNTFASGLKRNTFLPQDSIPSKLDYYYADYYPDNTSVVYQSNQNVIQATYKKPVQYTGLKIEKVEWLQNTAGIYTVVATTIEPNRGFDYSRNINTKAKVYYSLFNDSRKEVVETDILLNDLLNSTAALGVSNYSVNSNSATSQNLIVITYNDFLFNVIETPQLYEEEYSSNSKISSTSQATILVEKTNYLFNVIETATTYEEGSNYIINNSSTNSSITITITKSSYLLNNSGISIG